MARASAVLACLALLFVARPSVAVRSRSPGGVEVVVAHDEDIAFATAHKLSSPHDREVENLFDGLSLDKVVDVPFMSARLRVTSPGLVHRLNEDVARMIAEYTEDQSGRRLAESVNGTTITYHLQDDSFSTPHDWQFAFALRGGRLFAEMRTRTQATGWSEPVALELSPRYRQSGRSFWCLLGKSPVLFGDRLGEATYEFRRDVQRDAVAMRITYRPPTGTMGTNGGRKVLLPVEVAPGGLPSL